MQIRWPFRKSIAPVLGLLLLLSSGSLPAMAQDDSSNPGPSPGQGNSAPNGQGPGTGKVQHLNPDKMKKRRLAHLQQVAQLTPDQQTKITPIISDFVDQLVAIKNNSSIQPEEKEARQKELRKKFGRQLRALLTPQQRQALKNSTQAGQHPGKNPSQNEDPDESQFEQGSNQPGSGI